MAIRPNVAASPPAPGLPIDWFSLLTPLNLVAAVVVLCLGAFLVERFITGVAYPPSIPLVREPEGARRFSLRTRISYYTECRAVYEDAWNHVSRHSPMASLQ